MPIASSRERQGRPPNTTQRRMSSRQSFASESPQRTFITAAELRTDRLIFQSTQKKTLGVSVQMHRHAERLLSKPRFKTVHERPTARKQALRENKNRQSLRN